MEKIIGHYATIEYCGELRKVLVVDKKNKSYHPTFICYTSIENKCIEVLNNKIKEVHERLYI